MGNNIIKVLLICAHRPGRSPSQRYRFEQYLPALEDAGYRFTWSFLLNEKDDQLFYAGGKIWSKLRILMKGTVKRLRDAGRARKHDLIFIQREAFFAGGNYFEKMLARTGKPIIFDFDDAIWRADTSPGNLRWEWLKKPQKFYSNVKLARLVIAGNDYLASKAAGINRIVMTIPTTIDTSLHRPMPKLREDGFVTIGWSGSLSTLKHFQDVVPVLQKLRKKNSQVRFTVLGAASGSIPEPWINCIPWSESTEVAVLNTFDIGIMPLPDDEWARGKCGLKALSYMACGVATVASAVGVNSSIISHGKNGMLAGDGEEWLAALTLLIDDKEKRKRLGEEGRRTVEDRFSVRSCAPLYLEAFERAQL